MEMFGEGDLDGLMEDYADNAVLIPESGVLEGHDEIRGMFTDLLSEFNDLSVTLSLVKQIVTGDYGYIVWHAETPKNEYAAQL